MMKQTYRVILVTGLAVATLLGSNIALAASQSEGAIPQSGDLCGGTGGNGQIVSVGNNTFTLKLHEGGQKGGGNLLVTLADNAAIKTPTGYVSVSDLKIGDRVTLVGDNNRDGTFTADTVVLCSGTQENGTNHATPIIVRNHDTNYEKVNRAIHGATILLVGLIWLGIVAFLKLKKRKSFVYLLFFTIFSIYLYKVLDYTLLQFQSLLLLQHFLPNLMLNGVEAGRTVNLIPLATLRLVDVETSLLNILMMMPFGFGLPFITNFRFKKTVIAGLLLSIAIELLQLITGFMANTTFRIADINDVIFNTVGVAIGYMLFVGFVRLYRQISHNGKLSTNPILRYIAERPQVNKQPR
jgi:glycopeptide antibiotics resistance protein